MSEVKGYRPANFPTNQSPCKINTLVQVRRSLRLLGALLNYQILLRSPTQQCRFLLLSFALA